jgi:DNA polymerase-3 subunit gamma/tau
VTAVNASTSAHKDVETPAISPSGSSEQTPLETHDTLADIQTASAALSTDSAKQATADITPETTKPKLHAEEFVNTDVNEAMPEVNKDTLISVDLSPANWTQIISELQLSALTRQLAENSAFIRCEERTLQLALSSELAHLATSKSKERLEQALQKKLDQDVSVVFNHNADSAQSGPTVAVERAEQLALKQQQAIESIQNDPTIEVIKNTFNARIIESTIKPID